MALNQFCDKYKYSESVDVDDWLIADFPLGTKKERDPSKLKKFLKK